MTKTSTTAGSSYCLGERDDTGFITYHNYKVVFSLEDSAFEGMAPAARN